MAVPGMSLLAKFQQTDIISLIAEVVSENPNRVLDLNRKQLLRGQGKDGKLLSPKYSEDPWFKSAESANRYALWKQKLNPEAPFDTPDLYINGRTHNAMQGQVSGAVFHIETTVPWAADLDRKYNGNELGLNEQSLEEYRPELLTGICIKLKQRIGLP